jgi:AAA+ ATPase superfamily predicted ATPase
VKIVGRKSEQAVLEKCRTSKRPEFLAVYGRRRVGKTFLIREFFGGGIVFSFTGATRSTMRKQLLNFDAALAEYEGTAATPSANWFEAFGKLKKYLKDRIDERGGRKEVVFIDELPWLATQKSDFVAALEYFWNSWASSRPELLLVVCGSATSWILENIVKDHGGLHNRVTRRLLIEPFTLQDCEAYFRAMGAQIGRMQIAEMYMALGGIPFYLDYYDVGFSPAQNIDAMFFAQDAPLAGEFSELYASLFKKPENHVRIVETLGANAGGLTQKELEAASDIATGGTLTKTLRELEQCGFIRKYRDFTGKKKGHYYQLTDFYTFFYLKHIKDNLTNDGHYWQNLSRKGGQYAWNGLAFERVCMAHTDQIKRRLGIAGVSTETSVWRSKRSKPAVRIDLVLDREDGIINLCEMKFTGKKFDPDAAYEETLRERRETFREETGTKKALHLTMVTSSGLTPGSWRGEIQSEVLLDDLFES